MENKINEEKEILNNFCEFHFPLKQEEFKNDKELLNFFIAEEDSLNTAILEITKTYNAPDDLIRKIKYIIKENLTISFDKNSKSANINKKIKKLYIDIITLIGEDIKKIKNFNNFNRKFIEKEIILYQNKFQELLKNKFKNQEIFPNFILNKFLEKIKIKYLISISEKIHLNISEFFMNDDYLSLNNIYTSLTLIKDKFLFNSKSNKENHFQYFLLAILSNNNILKEDPKIQNNFYKNFNYFSMMFNLESEILKQGKKDYDINYNINLFIEYIINNYINIEENVTEKLKIKILNELNLDSYHSSEIILNIIISYTLIFNKLIIKDKVNSDISLFISDYNNASAGLQVLLENTLKNFNKYFDVFDLKDYVQSNLIEDLMYKIISLKKNKYYNNSYNIRDIKDIFLSTNYNKKLKEKCTEFFKGLGTSKRNNFLDFILNSNQDYKDKNIREISFDPMNKRIASTHCYILISGFLSEESDHDEEWENLTINLNLNNICYFYSWPSESLPKAMTETIFRLGAAFIKAYNGNENEIENKDNLWQKTFVDSSKKAELSGKILAMMLASKLFLKNQSVTLIGFSLGTHVIKNCIKELYNLQNENKIICDDIVKDVILIAGATSMDKKKDKYKNIFQKMISGHFYNCWSKNDQVLSCIYTAAMNKKPIGNSELDLNGYDKLINIDFSCLELGHTQYRSKMDLVMEKIQTYKK